MKSKIFLINILVASILSADTFINPLPSSSKAIDNGGVKQAIDAYKDGIGVEIIDKPGVATDNSPMNTLTFKYGETIVNQVLATPSATSSDLNLVNLLQNQNVNTGGGQTFQSTASNLVNKLVCQYSMTGSYWGQTGAGLFDNTPNGSHTTNQTVYWSYGGPTESLSLTASEPFRIWRSGYTAYPDYVGKLQILALVNGVYIDKTSTYHKSNFTFGASGHPNSGIYELFTEEMPAGTYKFNAISGQYRIDTEWFIEKKI
jgi:hypothetical protein